MPSIKRRSDHKYDGDTKRRTKNCDECNFKVDFYDKEICGWGKNFQYLFKIENQKKCEYFGTEPPENNSLNYVLYAKKNNILGKSKYKDRGNQLNLQLIYK